MNLLIDEVVRKYAEGLRRVADNSSVDSSVTSCESGLRNGTEYNFSVGAGSDVWCGGTVHNLSVTSGDFYSRRGAEHNYQMPRIPCQATATERRRTRRKRNKGNKYTKKS